MRDVVSDYDREEENNEAKKMTWTWEEEEITTAGHDSDNSDKLNDWREVKDNVTEKVTANGAVVAT